MTVADSVAATRPEPKMSSSGCAAQPSLSRRSSRRLDCSSTISGKVPRAPAPLVDRWLNRQHGLRCSCRERQRDMKIRFCVVVCTGFIQCSPQAEQRSKHSRQPVRLARLHILSKLLSSSSPLVQHKSVFAIDIGGLQVSAKVSLSLKYNALTM